MRLRLRPLRPEPGERFFEFTIGGRIGDHGMARANLARDFCKRCGVAPRADRFDAIALPVLRLIRSSVLVPTEPVAPRIVMVRTSAADFELDRTTSTAVMRSP